MIYATGGAASFVGAALSARSADKLGGGRAMSLGLAAMGLGFSLLTFAHGAGLLSIVLLVVGSSGGSLGPASLRLKLLSEAHCPPQKLPACPETRQIATNLKSRDQKHMTSVHAEILPALAERPGRFVALLDSQFTI